MLPASINIPICPLTNRSINSCAQVAFAIESKYHTHWFLGLREAELFIDEKQGALNFVYFKQRKFERQIKAKTRSKNILLSQEWNEEDQDRIEQIEDEIAQFEFQAKRLEYDVRDCLMELQTAIGWRDQILAVHPEAQEMSYEQLQTQITPQALEAVQANFIAARVWAGENKVSESASVALFENPIHRRPALIAAETQLRIDMQIQSQEIFAQLQLESERPKP